MQYDFSDFDDGKEFVNPSHLYTLDLDVFGEHSLFQYINRTATPIGKLHLANWFNAHLENKEAIEHRQEAIHELSTDLEYRQQIRLLGLLYKGKPADTTEIKEWAASPSYYRKRTLLRILPIAVTVINFLCIGLAILGIISASIAGGVFVGFVLFSTIFSKGITKLQTTYGEKLQILSTYADQILLTEQKEMHSHILQELKADLTSQNQTASQAVRQLSKLMNALDQRSNLLISTILNGLIFWELRQVMRIEKWKEIHASDLPRWIETIGEIDAYCSLATFTYNHPDYIFPKISSQSFHLPFPQGRPESGLPFENSLLRQSTPDYTLPAFSLSAIYRCVTRSCNKVFRKNLYHRKFSGIPRLSRYSCRNFSLSSSVGAVLDLLYTSRFTIASSFFSNPNRIISSPS